MKYLKLTGRFIVFVLQRFFQQRCTETAAFLSYTSLLSLVPMMAVIFAAFSSFIDLINTHHYDNSHNWILYYDHYYEKMYPIIWDPVGWLIGWEHKTDINIINKVNSI